MIGRAVSARFTAGRQLALVAVAIVGSAGMVAAAPAARAATLSGTFYVDNRAGSACSDTASGTSPSTPWCTFTPANSTSFAAGSQLLLARGDTFRQALEPSGSGTPSARITVGAYGTGNRPVITGSGAASDRTVVLRNPDYWRVQDLELSDAGEGIYVDYTTDDHAGIDIERIYAHDIQAIFHGSPAQTDFPAIYNSSAIAVEVGGAPVPQAGHSVVSNVTISDIEATRTAAVYLVGTSAGQSYPVTGIKDVDISRIYAHDSHAPEFAFEPSSNLHLTSSYVDCSGHIAEQQGTTCTFLYDIGDSVIAGNVFVGMNDTGSADETAIDVEGRSNNLRISGNYFGSNAGAGVELLQLAGRPGDYSTNTVIDSNTFYDNGGAAGSQHGQIAVANDPGVTPPGGTISNNVYASAPWGFVSNVGGSPDLSNITLTDNVSVATIFDSAYQFSSVQGFDGWREQSYNAGGSWADLPTHDATSNRWEGAGGAFVGTFELQPGSGSDQWVSRTWIAPMSGPIAIRGQVFKDGTTGDGVDVLIERNGTASWPTDPDYLTYRSISAADRNGYATDVDLTVDAGDTLRFVVWGGSTNSGDLAGWTPSISYS